MSVKISKPLAVMLAMIVLLYAAAALLQVRHARQSVLESTLQYRAAGAEEWTSRPYTPGEEFIFSPEANEYALAFHGTDTTFKRIDFSLRYSLRGGNTLDLALLNPSGRKMHEWPLPASTEEAEFHKIITPMPGDFRLLLNASEGVAMRLEVSAAVLREAPKGPNFLGKKTYLLQLMLAGFIVFWLIRRWTTASEWLLVGLSGAMFGIINPMFALVVFLFLLVIFLSKPLLLQKSSKRWVFFLLLLFLSVCFWVLFKYAPHWCSQVFVSIGLKELGFPIGASYFVFRIVHVIMEWYRGLHPDLTLRRFLCFVIFFPTIPAGPIENLEDFYGNMYTRFDLSTMCEGVWRILLGFFKKLFIVGFLLNSILFSQNSGLFDRLLLGPSTVPYYILVLTCLMVLFYVYMDLSAYTDIAIGVGLLFGYRICENFNMPLFQRNIGNFWKSYHMSLSNWCRRHVYFPTLLLSRNTSIALFLSMMTMGFWHHLNLNWGIWALHHGLAIIAVFLLEEYMMKFRKKLGWTKPFKKIWTSFAVCLTVLWVSCGISVCFIDDLPTALTVYARFLRLY